MPVPITLNFTLPDATARDLTNVASTQRVGATVIVGAIDNQTTQVVFRDVGNIQVGSRILCGDTNEIMVVTALPASAGLPCTVARGMADATLTIPSFPSAAAAAHADQTQVFILQFSGLVQMGRSGALNVIQSYLQRMVEMGLVSETLGSAIQTQAQATEEFQAAMNSVMS